MLTGTADFRMARDSLGLTVPWIADRLAELKASGADVPTTTRQLARWDRGSVDAHPIAWELLNTLADEAEAEVAALAAQLAAQAPDRRAVTTYRTDEAYRAAGGERPVTWHQAIVRRAIDRLPAGNRRCRIEWAEGAR